MYEHKQIRLTQRGYTLLESLVAVIIIGILISFAAPIYTRTVEQARLDSAAGNLKTIWSAQRAYWLKFHTFVDNLDALESEGLINDWFSSTQTLPDTRYIYDIDSADGDSFIASAVRSNSSVWQGQIQIDELGHLTGSISDTGGSTIVPQTLE